MATFSEIYFNGSEYTQMWLNGSKIWEKDSGGSGIDYPYPDADSVITYKSTYYSNTVTFSVIDNTLPYSINGTNTTSFSFSYGETQVKLVNLRPTTSTSSSFFPIKIEQLRIPNLTDLHHLFRYFCYDSKYEYSWSPQYFEFSDNVTAMYDMFYNCRYLTDEMMNQFMPYFPSTKYVTDMSDMFWGCSSLKTLDLSSFDTSNVIYYEGMFSGVSGTIYVGENWTLGTDTYLGGGSNTFVRINPITSITLESTLTDTTVPKGTIFTINPIITPIDYGGDEVVVTYNTNYLSMVDNTFTVLDNVPIGESLSITYASSSNPSISATYTITIRDYINIESITLQHTLDSLIIEPNTTFTITPITTPTLHEDELLVEFDDTYITHNDGVFTVTNAPYSESMSITYYSKANPSVNATLNLMVRDFIPITSITLEHTLDSLVIEPNTMFTVTPVITPTVNDDEVMIEFDDTYMAYNDGVFTVTNAPFNEPLSIKYSSKFDSTVYATLDLVVRDFIPITSITLQHTLETLVDVPTHTVFNIVPSVMPTLHDDELLVDYDTSYLSMENNTFTVLSGASEQTVQIIYYSKYNNSVYGMIEFTVAKEEEVQETVLTYNTFEKVANSGYVTYTTDETENTITMQCNTKTSSSYTSELWVQLDTPLPKKCRIKITGISNASIPSSAVSQGYPNNQLFGIGNNTIFRYNSTDVMPSNGIMYIEDVRTQIESYEGASKIGLFQTNPSLMKMGSNYSYPFEFETDYDFNFEPYLYLYCSTHYGGSSAALTTNSYVTYKDLQVEVHIKHCNTINLTSDIEDLTNVNQSLFTITPVTFPADAHEELIVTYDSNYLTTKDNRTFALKQGCQGQTLSITYTGILSNVSKTLTFTVSEDVEIIETLIDFTQSTAPTLPNWLIVQSKGTYSFKHGTYKDNSSLYGLVEESYSSSVARTYWLCYKVVAPMTGTLEITFRAYIYSSSYPFTIHATTNATQPSYSSSTDRLISATSTTYRTTDGVATLQITQGETYYIHFQHRRYGSSSTYGTCIRTIEIIPTE